MAILDDYPNIKVEITVNSAPLPEFDNDGDETAAATITKYVEAQTDAKFEVQVDYREIFHAKHDIVIDMYLDGQWATGHIMPRNQAPLACLYKTKEKVGEQYFESQFRFARLEIDDENNDHPSGNNLQEALKSTGDITLKLSWIEFLGESMPPDQARARDAALGVVPEKALKGRAISHQASFSDRKAIQSFKTARINRLYGGNPFATYVFKYRSRDALKALMIIPRSPSPPPREGLGIIMRDSGDSRPSQPRQPVPHDQPTAIKQENINREGIKRERPEDGDEDDMSFVSAKRVRGPITLNEDGVEVVDLT